MLAECVTIALCTYLKDGGLTFWVSIADCSFRSKAACLSNALITAKPESWKMSAIWL
jgi:hypothetical protein